jgi:hypothetical protein
MWKIIVFGAFSASDDPWDYLGVTNELNGNNAGWQALLGIAQDWYTLCFTVGIIGLLINFIIYGIKIGTSKNPNKRAAAKEGLSGKLIVSIMLFGITTIIGATVSLVEAFV